MCNVTPRFSVLLVSVLSLLLSGAVPAQLETRERASQPLPADEAFRLNVAIEDNSLVLRWDIAEGYYLYRDSIGVKTADPDPLLSRLRLPEGEMEEDRFFGEVEIYRDSLKATLPIEYGAGERADFLITYQGCAEKRYCYPEIEKNISIDF